MTALGPLEERVPHKDEERAEALLETGTGFDKRKELVLEAKVMKAKVRSRLGLSIVFHASPCGGFHNGFRLS